MSKKKKPEFKMMYIDADEFQKGDLVVNKQQNNVYLIIDFGKTILHGHEQIIAQFPNERHYKNKYKFNLCDYKSKRWVFRRING